MILINNPQVMDSIKKVLRVILIFVIALASLAMVGFVLFP